MPKIDFTSVNTIIQLLSVLLILAGFYTFRIIKNKNKTTVDLYKLVSSNQIGRLLEKAKSEVYIPDNLNPKQQFEIVKTQIEKRHKEYVLKVSILIIFILLFFATIVLLIFFPINNTPPSKFKSFEFSQIQPKIIGIYPSDFFGPDQKRGLHQAVVNSGLNFQVIDLDFLTVSQLQNGEIQKLIDTLNVLIKNENIISIVGPSVTECCNEILHLLITSHKKIPIFLTTAASKDFLKWDQYSKDLNLFRTGSGIDKRANLIANFLKEKDISKKSLFLIETNEFKNSFGFLYYEQLIEKSEILQNAITTGHIDTLYYTKNDSKKVYDYLRKRISSYDYIFVLGVGKMFRQIIDSFYNPTKNKILLPKIGGWMNGYSLNNVLDSKDFHVYNRKIFEITDLNLSRARNDDADPDINLKLFQQNFGFIHVGLRDIAITYDAGICITETYTDIYNSMNKSVNDDFIKFDNNSLNIFASEMRNKTTEGILSKIIFNNEGINDNITLDCAIFDSAKNNWDHIDIQDLLNL